MHDSFPDYVEVPLTNGGVVIVDLEDAERVSAYRWCKRKKSNTWYAFSTTHIPGSYSGVAMHRYLFGLNKGDRPHVDHKNHDGLDNRRCNVRLCTPAQNRLNARKQESTSRFKGVSWVESRALWTSKISFKVEGKRREVCFGYFATEIEAAIPFYAASELIRNASFLCLADLPENEMPSAERTAELRVMSIDKVKAVLEGRKGRLGATSTYHGVSFHRQEWQTVGQWMGRIRYDGAPRFLGHYESEEEAAYAHDYAAEQLHLLGSKFNHAKRAIPDNAVAATVRGRVDALIIRFLPVRSGSG